MRTPDRQVTRWDLAREARFIPWPATAALVVIVVLLLFDPDEHRFITFGLVAALFAAGVVAIVTGGWRPAVAAIGSAAGVLFAAFWPAVALAAATIVAVTLLTWWLYDRCWRPLNSAETTVRSKEHSNHNDGTASCYDLGQRASASAMRGRARVIRPSLAHLSDRALRALPPAAYAVLLARVNWTVVRGVSGSMGYHSSYEDVTLRIGGPRMGKTGSIACNIVDAPGAVVVTSTKVEIFLDTVLKRSKVGRVWVFNPTGLGSVRSSARWSPIVGCEDFSTATRRAESMIEDRPGEGQTWTLQARRYLAILLHAAALDRRNMRQVQQWAAAIDKSWNPVLSALCDAPTIEALATDLKQSISTNDRTRTSITSTLMMALQWVLSEGAADVGDPDLDDQDLFNVEAFVESGRRVVPGSGAPAGGDTLYVIGSPENAAVIAPLLSALTAEIGHQARMRAAHHPGGRLDPALSLFLDEITLAVPHVPIFEWTADMGGRGIAIHIATQSLAQLRDKYGADRAAALLNNAAALVVFGGIKDQTDLQQIAVLVGHRLEGLDPDDNRYQEVWSPARISQLARFEVLVIGIGVRPVLGTAPQLFWREAKRRRWFRLPRRAVRPEPITVTDPGHDPADFTLIS